MFPWIEIFDEKLPTYLVWISITYCFAIFYLTKRAKDKGFSEKIILDSALLVMVFGFLGARLLHVFYEAPEYYLEDPLRIFYIWQGGYVYFGGAISAFIAVKIWSLNKAFDFKQLLDIYAPVIIFGYALGRIGCLLAGCCHGDACNLPWAIVYPLGAEAPAGIPLHPTPIYASLWAFLHGFVLLFLEKKYSPRTNEKTYLEEGMLFYIAVMVHGAGRIIMETFRADHRGDSIYGLSVSTWISLFLIFLASRMLRNPPVKEE